MSDLVQQTEVEIVVPAPYQVRVTTLDDAEAIAPLINIVSEAAGFPEQNNPVDLRSDWQTPNYDLANSSRVVTDIDGQIVAYVNVFDSTKIPVHPWVDYYVHPNHEGQGFGELLMAWGEQRAHEAIDRCPPEARVSIRSATFKGYAPVADVLEGMGMQQMRQFYRMLINMTEAPPAPNLPDGISIRTYRHPDELEALIRAKDEGFKDHFGHVDQPFDQLVERFQHFIETDDLFDPSLYFLAIDDATGEIAGLSLCRSEEWEIPDAAYVVSLAVLPQYRRRGLALALLHHTFGEFWRRGRKDVSLGVDGSSLTGAVRLYERAGMHIDRIYVVYEKELRPGEELETTSAQN